VRVIGEDFGVTGAGTRVSRPVGCGWAAMPASGWAPGPASGWAGCAGAHFSDFCWHLRPICC